MGLKSLSKPNNKHFSKRYIYFILIIYGFGTIYVIVINVIT